MTSGRLPAVLALAILLAGLACGGGGGGSGAPTTPSPSPAPSPAPSPSPAPAPGNPAPTSATVTITASGVSPSQVTVRVGGRVTFLNNGTRPHDMSSDPHPEHTDCPEINNVGFINPGQSRETGNLVTVRTCGFHDHNQPTNSALTGTIVIVPE